MKPNLIVVQTAHAELSADLDKFFENFCDSHYVYLIRPGSEFREDSPKGIRFLSHPLDHLPDLADVDAVISVADVEAAGHLKAAYPDSRLAVWDPDDGGPLPGLFVSLLNPTIILGDFGTADSPDLARAM